MTVILSSSSKIDDEDDAQEWADLVVAIGTERLDAQDRAERGQ